MRFRFVFLHVFLALLATVRLSAQTPPAKGDLYRVPLAALVPQQDTANPNGLLDAFQRAGRAQQQGNFSEMRRLLRAGNSMAPGNGQVLFFLAREEARAGNTTGAFAFLEQLAVQGATRDLRADTLFNALKQPGNSQRFDRVVERISASAAALVRSDTQHVLADPDFIPEGIAYDSRDKAFYIGSLHRRTVVRIDSNGVESVFANANRDSLGQVLGIHLDAANRRLWFATLVLDSAAPRHSNGGSGWAFVHAYDIPSGRIIGRYAAPDSTRPHLLNDLVVTASGDVYVTDTENHAVYRLTAGARRLEQVYGNNDRFRFPNGIALDTASRRVYIAHFEGISTAPLDRAGGGLALTPLQQPTGVAGGGIDGMYYCGSRLIAVQGMFGFQQVTAFNLDAKGTAVASTTVLERRHPIHDWATTGALVGPNFHYIANAQLRRLSPSGTLSPPALPGRSTVLRLRNACS